MSNILILGAHGHIARLATQMMLKEDLHLRLFLRNSSRLKITIPEKEELFEGDATSYDDLMQALKDIDVVYANLAGEIVTEAKVLVKAMHDSGVKRLIWISTLGIYDEVPGDFGKWNYEQLDGDYLETYSEAAKIIEESGLDYTIIRPAWLSNHDELEYEITFKGQEFKGTEVSRKSIAELVTRLCVEPNNYIHESLGVNKPNTDGSKPSWYR